MSIKNDKYFINLANNLAKNSSGYSGPNPSVGAIVVKNNKIISFANTSFSGRPHAETNALNKLSFNKKKNQLFIFHLNLVFIKAKLLLVLMKLLNRKLKE